MATHEPFLIGGAHMRRRDGILAVVAVLSIVIYSLACRPAWHPDSDRVAFVFQENEVGGVVIYDLRTGELKRIFETADETPGPGHCVWSADGKSVFFIEPGKHTIKLIAIEEETGAVREVASIGNLHEEVINYLPPVPGSDRYLWLSMLRSKENKEYFCARIDLKTGEVKRFFESESKISWVSEFASRGVYCFEIPSDEPEPGSIEVFTFDPLSGERTAAFKTDVPGRAQWPFIAAEPDGERFACVIEREEKFSLLLFDAEGHAEISLDPSVEATGYVLWLDPDEIIISVGMETEKEGATEKRAGLLSVNLESGETKFMALLSLDRGDDDFIVLMLQPAYSPDGRFFAVMVPAGDERPLTSLALFGLSEDSDEPVFITVPPKIIKDAPAEEHSEAHEPAEEKPEAHEPAAEGTQENE